MAASLEALSRRTNQAHLDRKSCRFRHAIPGQEFFDLIDGMVGDALKDVTQVAFGVEIVEFRGADERVDCRGTLPTVVGEASEKRTRSSCRGSGDGTRRGSG